jgi:hypothetical protein
LEAQQIKRAWWHCGREQAWFSLEQEQPASRDTARHLNKDYVLEL